MSTINQTVRLTRFSKKKKNKVLALHKNPQQKGTCLKVFTMTPKKPNSAIRKVVRVKLTNGTKITTYIPSEGHNLQEFLLF